MGKIKNLILFSEQFNVSRQTLSSIGVFNPILNLDTQLFIDPILIKSSTHKIIREDALKEYNNYFGNIISLVSFSTNKDDFAWANAFNLLPSKEICGTCLGYGANSTSGRGLSVKVKNNIILTTKEIVNLGVRDPGLFSILPLFNKNVGADTISDITTAAIHKSLLKFTAEKAKDLKIQTSTMEIDGEEFDIIQNPLKKESYILLVPVDILRKLPVVTDWEDIEYAASFNSLLRNRVNKYLAPVFQAKTKKRKKELLFDLMSNPDFMRMVMDVVNGYNGKAYDQITDNDRLVVLSLAKDIITPEMQDDIRYTTTQIGLNSVVTAIIDKFTFIVESRGLNRLLWKEDRKTRCKEGVAQLLFYAVALSYCDANDIDINPEMDTGRGLIDFKFSVGYTKKCIVEIKYSDNPNLIKGYQKQLEEYKKSEETSSGMYVVLDAGRMGCKQKQLYDLYNSSTHKSELFFVDTKLKPSASKLK